MQNRRANTMRSRLLVIGIISAIAVVVLLVGGRNLEAVKAVRAYSLTAVSPLIRVSRGFQKYASLLIRGEGAEQRFDDYERFKELEANVQTLKNENETLREALGLRNRIPGVLNAASVLLYSTEAGREFLLIDRGSEAGVQEGLAVIDSRGALIGAVREVHERMSKVSIASNAGETFEVQLLPLGAKALARGEGNRGFLIDLVASDVPVEPGDLAVIPGKEGISGNILLGAVARTSNRGTGAFQEVRAVLLGRPDLSRQVFVVSAK